MEQKSKRNREIDELYKWTSTNTNLLKINPELVVRYIDAEKEKLEQDLFFVNNIFEEMVNYAQTKFKIGKFVSIGYSNTVILKLTENFDIIEFRKKCEERQMLVNPPLSKTSKNKLVREILEEVLKEIGKDEIGNKEFEDKLISNQNFDREQVKEDIMKAMKVGLIQETHKGFFSI
jgi:hypothetical protein